MSKFNEGDRVVIRTQVERLNAWDGVTGTVDSYWGTMPHIKPDNPRPDGNGLAPFCWPEVELRPFSRTYTEAFMSAGVSLAEAVENMRRNIAQYVAADTAQTARLRSSLMSFGIEPVSFGFKTEDESCEGIAPGMPDDLADTLEEAADDALDETDAQFAKWGDQRGKSLFEWVSILTEEVGEFAQAVNDGERTKADAEAVQVAGVALSILATLRATNAD